MTDWSELARRDRIRQTVAWLRWMWWLVPLLASAQVAVRYSPEPMAVPLAVLANARDMGLWQWDICLDSTYPQAIVLPIQRVYMAAGPIAFIDQDHALLVLTANVRRSTPARLVKIGSWGLFGVGVATSLLATHGNLSNQVHWLKIGAGLSAAGTTIPVIVDAIKAEVPSATPLLSTVRWPITLIPGQCITDHQFAAKMKSPKPLVVQIHP